MLHFGLVLLTLSIIRGPVHPWVEKLLQLGTLSLFQMVINPKVIGILGMFQKSDRFQRTPHFNNEQWGLIQGGTLLSMWQEPIKWKVV